jgi:hypothetical protein
MAGKVHIRVCSSIVEKDGKFGPVIHLSDGKVLVPPICRFDTIDEAKEAGTKILNAGMKRMQKEGLKAFRPESN